MISHLVKLWKTGSAEDFSLPNKGADGIDVPVGEIFALSKGHPNINIGVQRKQVKEFAY